ncbi:Protein CHROMATIN REMODELING 4 [Bienertia sinuspersici]
MKEKGPTPSKMISRNWVLKRKRKKLQCGADVTVTKKKEDDVGAESAGNSDSSGSVSHQELTLKRARTVTLPEKLDDGGKSSSALSVSPVSWEVHWEKEIIQQTESWFACQRPVCKEVRISKNRWIMLKDFDGKLHTATRDTEKVFDASAADQKSNCVIKHNVSLSELKSETAKKREDSSNKNQCIVKNTASASASAHKKNHKSNKDRNKKKSKISVAEPLINKGQKRKLDAPSPKISKPQRKRRSVHYRFSLTQENAVSGKIESQQEEVYPREAVGLSLIDDMGPAKTALSEVNSFDETLQVYSHLYFFEASGYSLPCQNFASRLTQSSVLLESQISKNQTSKAEHKADLVLLGDPEDTSVVQFQFAEKCIADHCFADTLQACGRTGTEVDEGDKLAEAGKELGSGIVTGDDDCKSKFSNDKFLSPQSLKDQTDATNAIANDSSCDNKVLEPTLAETAKRFGQKKLDNYKTKYGTASINICEERWKQPQRVIALRSSKSSGTEAFIKWSGLPYDECTWERTDEPAIRNSLQLIDQFRQFERQTLEKDVKKTLCQGEIIFKRMRFSLLQSNLRSSKWFTFPAPARSSELNLIRQYEWHAIHPDDLNKNKKSLAYKFNVLLTTYEMVLADSSHLRGIPWEVLIVDEGHRLKNSSSKLFSLLNAFSFQQRVEELKKLVAPHMLRRLKKDAMQNIPPKTERMVPVELSSIQAEYYLCNHPYLIPGTEPDSGSLEFLHEMRIKASAKLTVLHSMLKLLHKEGHRVLIFSQMTKLLDILEDYLNFEFGRSHLRELMDQFQLLIVKRRLHVSTKIRLAKKKLMLDQLFVNKSDLKRRWRIYCLGTEELFRDSSGKGLINVQKEVAKLFENAILNFLIDRTFNLDHWRILKQMQIMICLWLVVEEGDLVLMVVVEEGDLLVVVIKEGGLVVIIVNKGGLLMLVVKV